jgi:Reticulon
LKPRRYYQINKSALDVFFVELANVANFLVLEFQRLLFAEKTSHTAVAFLVSYIAYKLVRYIPLWCLALMGTIIVFAAPPLYLLNQEVIDKHILQAQSIAAEKAAYARHMAEAQVGAVSERAKTVTSEWGRKAGVELPWSPSKTSPPAAPASTATTSKAPVQGSSTGIEALSGLNVPQTTPQKRVDPHKVPLPETPAQAAQ